MTIKKIRCQILIEYSHPQTSSFFTTKNSLSHSKQTNHLTQLITAVKMWYNYTIIISCFHQSQQKEQCNSWPTKSDHFYNCGNLLPQTLHINLDIRGWANMEVHANFVQVFSLTKLLATKYAINVCTINEPHLSKTSPTVHHAIPGLIYWTGVTEEKPVYIVFMGYHNIAQSII